MPVDTARAITLLVSGLLNARTKAVQRGNVLLGQIDADLVRVAYAIAALARSGAVLDRATANRLITSIQAALSDAGDTILGRITLAMAIGSTSVVEETNAALAELGLSSVEAGPVTSAALAAAQRIRGAPLRTLINRHIADAQNDVRDVIEAAISAGTNPRTLANSIALVIRSRTPGPLGAKELASIGYDARMIGRSEIMNALRSSYRTTLTQTGIVAAVQFTTSSAHYIVDECDDLANANDYGFGKGYYPPERFPDGPHPHCACYAGDVILKDVSDWPQKPA